MAETIYDTECEIYCTDTGNIKEVEILNFNPGRVLTVSIDRQVRLTLQYDTKYNIYIGNMAGMEFTSRGPNRHEMVKIRHDRRRF